MYIMYECTLYLHVLKLVNCIVNYKYTCTCTCTCTYSPVYLWNLLDSSIILSIYKYMYMYVCWFTTSSLVATCTCTCTALQFQVWYIKFIII